MASATKQGKYVELSLLRSPEWVEANCAYEGEVIHLTFSEWSLAGPALVLAHDPCPPLQAGPGRVVLSTLMHTSNDIGQLSLSDGSTIGLTASHPIYSLEHEGGWTAAAKLRAGDGLATYDGSIQLSSVKALPRQAVFNIEVEFDHRYYAGAAGVLSHNACNDTTPSGSEDGNAPREVYRRGSSTDNNLTPRPKDAGTGLSTNVNPPKGKSQVIDTERLNDLEAVQDGTDHVSIRPKDPSKMQDWVDSKTKPETHPLTQELREAIVREEKN